MIKKLPLKVLLSVMTLLFSLYLSAQPPAFTLNVTATAQTCLGNGTLSFTVTGTDPAATLDYKIYLLPDTTTPLVATTNTTVGGLVAGTYMVIATQSLNGNSNTATDTVTLTSLIQPLAYTLSSTPEKCGNDGTITINVTSGNAVSFETTLGPVIVPPQASNTLTGLEAGTYQVRVKDNCGEAVVVTYQVLESTTSITIDAANIIGDQLPSCTTILVENTYWTPSSNEIYFPLSVQYTIMPPGGGAPTIINTTVGIGGNFNILSTTIPFFHDQQYSFNIRITDACGNVYTRNNNIVNAKLTVEENQDAINCGDNFFDLQPSYYVAPFTVNFLSSPAGFNPAVANPQHPTFSGLAKYGDIGGNYVPEGDYTAQITDACGRTATVSFTIEDPEVEPQVLALAEGCVTVGSVSIAFDTRSIVTIQMTAAPPGYPQPLPQDVSAYISPTGFLMGNLPLGSYTFVFTDSCGIEYTEDVTLAASPVDAEVIVAKRQGCQPGYGSMKVTSPGEDFTGVSITAAPEGFAEPLPFDGSGYIAEDGNMYINSLPEGVYTFTFTDLCGIVRTQDITITGYETTVNDVEIIPQCGSFNVNLHHTSNGSYIQSFWLQKYNPVEGVWEHPEDGTNYTEGGQPNSFNSKGLTNNFLNINNGFLGQFRVIKTFFVYSNGTPANQRCVEVIHEFEFDEGPVITAANSFPCANNTTEVAITATGVEPLTYMITSKNGDPFVIDNEESNLFTGLEPATYNFMVTDDCGNIRNRQFDINEIDPITIGAEGFCEGEDSSLSVQEFSFLDYEWYKAGTPGTILSTTGTLAFPDFNSATDSGTYIVSITSTNPESCTNQELEYTLDVNTVPDAGEDDTVPLCNDGQSVNLTAYLSTSHDAGGVWEDVNATGALTGNTLNTAGLAAGTYQFKYIVSALCDLTDEAIITLQLTDIPQVPVITGTTPVCEGNDLQFTATEVPGATYQWTGPAGFTSAEANPLLAGISTAASGTYSLIVTVNGCASQAATLNITVNPAPRAGVDNVAPVCNDGSPLDVAGLLSAPHDAGGVWEDIDGTGALTGSTLTTAGLAAGNYQFRYTVTNICNETDDAIITVALKDIPQPPAATGTTPICEGENLQLTATPVEGATYNWTGPDGFTSTEQNPLITASSPAANGLYSVTVTVNDCASQASTVAITVNPVPQFSISGNTSLCEGQTSILSVLPDNFDVNAVTYEWYYDNVLMPDVTDSDIEILETGDYRVVVNGVNGCMAQREVTATLNDNPFTVEIEAGCVNYNYILSVVNSSDIPGATYAWWGPNGFSYTGAEADITNMAPGEYFVAVTSADGCTVEASITIDNTSCIIPRGISPNGDGLNDSFDLSNLEVQEIKIFNRYGLKVYESNLYLKEWYGQSDKGDLPTGTYYYAIMLSAGKEVTGWVYLQR